MFLTVASSLSDVSVLGGPSSVKIEISQYPDPIDRKANDVISNVKICYLSIYYH